MNKAFIATQVTLLQKLAAEKTGEDEAAWARFFDLYYPAMVAFTESLGGRDDAEDICSQVLVKLVAALRAGQYVREEGKTFRAYLKTLIRNELSNWFRAEKVRGYGRKVELTPEICESVAAEDRAVGAALDAQWAAACQKAAVEHVLTRTALSPQSKSVYRAYVVNERPIGEVASAFGISRNLVSQIKLRVDRMVSAALKEYGD